MSRDSTAALANTALTVNDHDIRRDGDMWCLTDLWRASGAPEGIRPHKWLDGADARRFVEFIEDSQSDRISVTLKKKGNPRKGEPPTTWAHWQIALAYAKALSPSFHARVNEVYRVFTARQTVPAPLPSAAREELIRLTLRFKSLEGGVESVWSLDLKLELARLRRIIWTGNGVEPQPLAFAYGRTWRIILGDAVYEELKQRNPHPRAGQLHAAWLEARRYEIVRREDLVIALVLARRCARWAEYETEMRAHFRRAPIQMRLAAQEREPKVFNSLGQAFCNE